MTTTPTPEPSPRERGRKTCRAAYMAVISMHHAVDLCDLVKLDPFKAGTIGQTIVAAAHGLEELDGLRGDICEPDLLVQIQLDDIAAAVRRALNAAPGDTRPPLALVADLIAAAEEAGAEIEARDLADRIADGITIGHRKLDGVVPVTLPRRADAGSQPASAGASLAATLDEDGGATCRSILRDALQAPPDDTRHAVALARDLVGRYEHLHVTLEQVARNIESERRVSLMELKQDAGGRGWLAGLIYADGPENPDAARVALMCALHEGARARGVIPEDSVLHMKLDEQGRQIFVDGRQPRGFTPRTEEYRNRLMQGGKSVYEATKTVLDAGSDAGSGGTKNILIAGVPVDVGDRLADVAIIADPSATHGWRPATWAGDKRPPEDMRRLMTAADFKTPEEFEIYRAGADRLPLGVLPGSWEGHLLTAMAAMVAAGIERHEVRMAPIGPVKVDAENVFDLAYDRLSKSAQAAMDTKANDARKIRGLGEALARLGWDSAQDPMRFAQALIDNPAMIYASGKEPALTAAQEERARIVKAIRGRSQPSEKDYPVERHIAELIERGML